MVVVNIHDMNYCMAGEYASLSSFIHTSVRAPTTEYIQVSVLDGDR